MKNILAFGATNSQKSINKQLAFYAASQVKDAEVQLLDLNDFEMPLYGPDLEAKIGTPRQARDFFRLIGAHDGLVISLAEYNHNFTTAFKNIIDWTSRINRSLWQQKPLFLLSTSPGSRGAHHIMNYALEHMPYMGANIVANYSLPYFRQAFSDGEGIVDAEAKLRFDTQLQAFEQALEKELVGA